MVNFNGQLVDGDSLFLNHHNRAFRFADALEERLRIVSSKIVFWEEHYLKLVASMRIMRMRIPMTFTMEFLEEEILKTIKDEELSQAFEVNIFVYREDTSSLIPEKNDVSYLITTKNLVTSFYQTHETDFEIELFKDHFIASGLLSTLETSSKTIEIVAGIFAGENDYNGCLLLNIDKQVIDSTHGSVFLVKDQEVKTSPLKNGSKNRVIRKKVIEIFQKWDDYSMNEDSISPFELQKADELFICDDIFGVIPVTKYRKKMFKNVVSTKLAGRLNALARFS